MQERAGRPMHESNVIMAMHSNGIGEAMQRVACMLM